MAIYMVNLIVEFEWDEKKNKSNIDKHGISFETAKLAFFDSNRIITEDAKHSNKERRYFCFGKTTHGILTVRFTIRNKIIRIIGAGLWREGKTRYEEENKV